MSGRIVNGHEEGRVAVGQGASPKVPTREFQVITNAGSPKREERRMGNNDFFRMGAVVAVGELFDEGLLAGDELDSGQIARDFLSSFGVRSLADVEQLGICGLNLDALKKLYVMEV